jgi:hypothetical protein
MENEGIRATITDPPGIGLAFTAQVGDEIGSCNGHVVKSETGLVAEVNPNKATCSGCWLKKYCSESLAV